MLLAVGAKRGDDQASISSSSYVYKCVIEFVSVLPACRFGCGAGAAALSNSFTLICLSSHYMLQLAVMTPRHRYTITPRRQNELNKARKRTVLYINSETQQ